MCHGKEFLWKYKVLGEAFLLKQRRDIRKGVSFVYRLLSKGDRNEQ